MNFQPCCWCAATQEHVCSTVAVGLACAGRQLCICLLICALQFSGPHCCCRQCCRPGVDSSGRSSHVCRGVLHQRGGAWQAGQADPHRPGRRRTSGVRPAGSGLGAGSQLAAWPGWGTSWHQAAASWAAARPTTLRRSLLPPCCLKQPVGWLCLQTWRCRRLDGCSRHTACHSAAAHFCTAEVGCRGCWPGLWR